MRTRVRFLEFTWWCTPIMSVLGRQRQDPWSFGWSASLAHLVSSRPMRGHISKEMEGVCENKIQGRPLASTSPAPVHVCSLTLTEKHISICTLLPFLLFIWLAFGSECCYIAQAVFNSSSCLSPRNAGIIVAAHHCWHRNSFLSCLWY